MLVNGGARIGPQDSRLKSTGVSPAASNLSEPHARATAKILSAEVHKGVGIKQRKIGRESGRIG